MNSLQEENYGQAEHEHVHVKAEFTGQVEHPKNAMGWPQELLMTLRGGNQQINSKSSLNLNLA